MNKVFLLGNLTKDCETTKAKSGTTICRFTLAVKRAYKTDGEDKTDFFNVSVFGNLAESCAKYLSKGKKALVSGNIQLREYEDNNGNKQRTVDIIGQEVEFLSPKEDKKNEYLDEDCPF